MIGKTLGPYLITSALGSGGMGSVYAATVVGKASGGPVGTTVALKIVHPHLLERPSFFKRFVREAEIGKTVQHENVVRTHDADAVVHDGVCRHYLVMEYVEGQTVRELLTELDCVPEKLCRHIGSEVARGLAAIHAAGVVHRDLKPDNVLITPEHAIKVMDLGVARLADEIVRLSRSGEFVGSFLCAAPEQFSNHRAEVDHRVDLHALGLLLYELACGQHPFEHDDMRRVVHSVVEIAPRGVAEINPQLSPFFEEVVHRLLAKDPDDRFQTATELAEVLEQGESSAWWETRAAALQRATRQPLRRIRIPRETALYGREDDLANLNTLYDLAKSGDGRVLLIEGEAGIGKTRLVDEFVGRLRKAGEELNFLFGSYPPTGAAMTTGALSTAFREHLGPEGSAEKLGDRPLLVPAFDAVLRGDAVPRGAEPLTLDSLGASFVHVMQALAATRPVVLLVDDLHFAPDEARGLFAALALAVPDHRVLLIGTLRPGVPAEWMANISRLEQTSHVTLSRLGPKDLALLLEDSFHSKRLAEGLDHKIALMSDGNPFFVFEIIRGLREGQFIRQAADGSWDTARKIGHIQTPPSVLDLVNARVADLSEQERELLDVAACCGAEFDPRLIGDVLLMRPVPLLRMLARIERKHRLVRSAGVRFVFDHHQVQEALYSGLSELLRREYHAALAKAIEVREGAAERDPTQLAGALCANMCEHYFRGDRGEEALRYIEAALDHLKTSHLGAGVVTLVDRALETPGLVDGERRVDLLLRKASSLELDGRRDDERSALDAALPLAEDLGKPGPLARVLITLGGHLFQGARYDEARAALSRGIELAREAHDEFIETDAARHLGNVSLWEGRYADARKHFHHSLALAQRIGDRRAEASAIGCLGNTMRRVGRHEDARQVYERSLVLAREIGFLAGETSALGNLAPVCRRLGLYDEARKHFEDALRLSRVLGYRRGELSDTGNLGNLFFSLGQYDEARVHHERALVLARAMGDRRWEDIALHNLANALTQLGEVHRAHDLLERSRTLASEIGDRGGVDYGDWLLGDQAAWAGDFELAEQLLTRSAASFRAAGSLDELADVLVSLAALRNQMEQPAAAIGHLDESVEIVSKTDASCPAILARCHLAVLRGDDASGAVQALAEHGALLEHHRRREAHFLLWKATADPAHLLAANTLLEETLDANPATSHTAMRENVPLNRSITAAWDARSLTAAAD